MILRRCRKGRASVVGRGRARSSEIEGKKGVEEQETQRDRIT